MWGISRQAMSKKLNKALKILRSICFDELRNLKTESKIISPVSQL